MGLNRLFGTDGIRGTFGSYPLDSKTVTDLGYELARTLGDSPRLVLAGDSRDSTPEICRWLIAGLRAGGASGRYGGMLPTPAVAHLVRQSAADAGIAVSASHNPHPDNGIKLFDGRGFKWSDEAEEALEQRLLDPTADRPARLVADAEATAVPEADPKAAQEYLDALESSLPDDRPLDGLRIAVDAANGAASPYAGPLLDRLGAEVSVYHASPDGRNINLDCGSTRPEALQRTVVEGRFDLGLAFDGDADRALLIDEKGALQDGDAMLYLWASSLAAEGLLSPPTLVATTMSNLGLEHSLAAEGIGLRRCGVGDRQVVSALRAEGLALGGEQSGHLVHLGLASTGDGLMTAIQIAHIVARSDRPVSELLAPFERFPQTLVNVRVDRKLPFEELPSVSSAVSDIEHRLGHEGRLVLRYSGTEPLARVMIEGPDQGLIEELAGSLADELRRSLSSGAA